MSRLPIAILLCVAASNLLAASMPYHVVVLDKHKQVLIRVDMDTGAQTIYPIDVAGLTNPLETVAVQDESVFLTAGSIAADPPGPFPHLVELNTRTGQWTNTVLNVAFTEPYDSDVTPDGNVVVASFVIDNPVIDTIYVRLATAGRVNFGPGADPTWVEVDSTGAIITTTPFEGGAGITFLRKEPNSAITERIDLDVPMGNFALETDGTIIASGSLRDDRKLYRVNLTNATSQLLYQSPEPPLARLHVDPQGRIIASLIPDTGELVRIDLETATEEVVRLEGGYVVSDFDILIVESVLQPGDADQDLDFDQFDLVQVQQAGKYLTGSNATWGEGDWNGAPGGTQGNPPAGDGLFDQRDIIAAQLANIYLMGPYAALALGDGARGDGQTSIVYNAGTGELAVDAPATTQLTSINIDSASGIFTGAAAQNLGGSFDNDSDTNIFKATFGSSFGLLSFGAVAQPGLAESFLLGDLTVVGSLAGGGDLGAVDLVYVPEPGAAILFVCAMAAIAAIRPIWRA